MPRAKKFLHRSMLLASRPRSLSASARELGELDREEPVAVERVVLERVDVLICAFFRSASLKSSVLTMRMPFVLQVGDVGLERGRVHGHQDVHRIARRVDVAWTRIDLEAARRPGSVPAGARISAGKSGKVARSLPNRAAVLVNWLPVICMPSPESPQKRMTAWSSCCFTRAPSTGASVVATSSLYSGAVCSSFHRIWRCDGRLVAALLRICCDLLSKPPALERRVHRRSDST